MTATNQPNLVFALPPVRRVTADTAPTALGLLVGTKAALYALAPAITGSAGAATTRTVGPAPSFRQRPELARRKP